MSHSDTDPTPKRQCEHGVPWMHDCPTCERDALAADARRYRFIRDADRSGHLDHELRLYAMETLDEYVDAALEDEAALDGAKGE